MLLGFDSFAALPISASGNEGNVILSVTGNALSITIGNPGITADSVTELVDGSDVVLGLGTVTITGDANLSPTGSQGTLGTGTVTVTAGATTAVSGNNVVISSGTVTITADSNHEVTGNALTLSTGTVSAITWSAIVPGATMTWTPIDPN